MTYTYSIIIPYRDCYDLLLKAILSIPDRLDIQVIIIDNSDYELDECKMPVKNKAKVSYVRSDSAMGAGRARNVGLEMAEGRFILFLDADDYFTDNAFESFDKYCNSDYDIVFFKADSVYLKTGEKSKRHDCINNMIDIYNTTGNEDVLRYKLAGPVCKMFCSDFLYKNNMKFDEIKVANDVMFSLRSGHTARKIASCDDVVYVITEGDANSSLTKTKTAENQFLRYKIAIENYKFMTNIGRLDLRYHLLSKVVHSLIDFGPKEFLKYLCYARKEKVNIYVGFSLKKFFKR